MVPHASRTLVVRAPTRVDLGGGWTDVPPYPEESGGFVCNVAIDLYATAIVRSSETYPAASSPAATRDPMIEAAIRRSGVRDATVSLTSGFPVGAGLGGSSAALAAVVTALRIWRGQPTDPVDVAEQGRRIEVEDLGISGGRQDHYAATHGGALALEFGATVGVTRIPMSPGAMYEFERSSVLVYTGESRISSETIRGVIDAYRARNPGVVHALGEMKRIARDMAVALESSRIDALGPLLAEHWEHQRSLHPGITTQRIDEIVRCARDSGATGWKAMGASGGGCVLVTCPPAKRIDIRDRIGSLGTILPFAVAARGAGVAPEADR